MMKQKSKNIILCLAIGLLLVVAYQMAISKTMDIRKDIQILESKKTELGRNSGLAATLMGRESYADSVLQKHRMRNSSVQSNLLEFLNRESMAANFSISEFSKPHTFVREGVTIHTYQLTLKGTFAAMEQVLYKMEQHHNYGSIAHVSFERKKNYRLRKNELECYVVIENLPSQ